MANLELPKLAWPDEERDETAFTPTPGGIFDGLSSPDPGSSLHLLMDPKDIATIDGLHEAAYGDQRSAAPLTIGQIDPDHLVLGHPDGNYLPVTGPKNSIGPVRGYPETGKDAWRAGNDDAIVAAAKEYNSEHGYFPGDAEYMSPRMMKAWQMRESGGDRQAFETDPFQVNKRGDWPDTGEKTKIAGLSKGQVMTPQTSADAALKWARYKSTWPGLEFSSPLARKAHYGAYEALRNYNGSPQKTDYANDVLSRAWASYGDWQK